MGIHYFKKPKKILKTRQEFHDEVLVQAEEIRALWQTKRPRLKLVKSLVYTASEIQAGAFQKHFPGFYKLTEVQQKSDWHTDTALDHTIKTLKKTRTMIKRMSTLEPAQHKIIRDYFGQELWGETRQHWFDWFVLFHDCGKLATNFIVRGKTQFISHEMAGAQLLKKWLTAVEIPVRAEQYLRNMIIAHSTIHNLLDDPELSHKGILIHARKYFSDYEILELLILSISDLFASQLKQNFPIEYDRRMDYMTKALKQLLNELSHS